MGQMTNLMSLTFPGQWSKKENFPPRHSLNMKTLNETHTCQSALESVENKRDKTGIHILWCMALCRSFESFIKQPENLCGPDQQFFRCFGRTSKSSIRPSQSSENLFTLIHFKSWFPRKLAWKSRAHANVCLQRTELIRRPFHTAH